IIDFRDYWKTRPNSDAINKEILSLYMIDLSDGIQLTDVTATGNPYTTHFRSLFDKDGKLLTKVQVQAALDFFDRIIDFRDYWKTRPNSDAINKEILSLYMIDLSDGIQLTDVTAFGNPTAPNFNPLFDKDGKLL